MTWVSKNTYTAKVMTTESKVRISVAIFYLLLFFIALIPTGAYAYWLYYLPWDLKYKIDAWDPFVKIMAIVGAVIVVLATFERFLDQRQQESVKDMVALAQSRNEVFGQATRTASAIATSSDLNSVIAQGGVLKAGRLAFDAGLGS